jgi:hypothetical protein
MIIKYDEVIKMANEIFVPSDFPTISSAVAAANTYDTIRVAPGTYNETVIVNKTIQLLGSQAGVNARTRNTLTESIVTSNNIQGVIQITADNVVVDGFTIQGNNLGPGIFTHQAFSGFWVFNNIIRDNSYGLYINTSGTTISQVKTNLFFNNNNFGNAVYSDQGGSNIYIDSNLFAGQHNSASINFVGPAGLQNNIIISHNEMNHDNSIALTNTTNVKVTHNTMLFTQGSSIFFGGSTNLTDIENNILHNSISNGISVTNVFTGGTNANIRAKQNSIQGNATAGLNIQAGAYDAAPPNRRLDATNNWWGSPNGPAPIGTGDAVIDPDGVAEVTPFLTSDPLAQPNLILSTGPLQSRGSQVQMILVDLLNNDPTNLAAVEILGFHMSTSGTKIPYVHELIGLNQSSKMQRSFVISIDEEVEFQFAITGSTDVQISVWGVDMSNNVTPVLTLLAAELQPINTLTPGVP